MSGQHRRPLHFYGHISTLEHPLAAPTTQQSRHFAHVINLPTGVFKRLLPFSAERNARLLLVNRRDYPGSEPYTSEERAHLARVAGGTPDSPQTKEDAKGVMRDRARELFNFLVDYVKQGDIPQTHGKEGGIIVVGWSFGSIWITSLLASVREFAEKDVQLSKYVRRVILFGNESIVNGVNVKGADSPQYPDASYLCYGYAPPPNAYQPLYDESLPDSERVSRFAVWVTGYYAHGDWSRDSDKALEFRNALSDPPPTATRMTPQDLAETTYGPPQAPDGSDPLIAQAGVRHGACLAMKDGAFYLQEPPVHGASDWANVEVVVLWGDRTIWEVPWGTMLLQRELEEAKKEGKRVREVKTVRIKGANHFAQWDMPEKMLKAFLTDDLEVS
ncbi:hypothetical protein BN946_scf184983.g4 [Trametes cinnabarina]|uniref:AB hydrolase-1 domain-containing protein n=1 Tax=Pycnoporus cinnabarinus TaxID=5643 RepID=A0A060SE77_PYCCI|nr:hypothetical protein BN946_scf184983.g4 [Trametes cinnabarina]